MSLGLVPTFESNKTLRIHMNSSTIFNGMKNKQRESNTLSLTSLRDTKVPNQRIKTSNCNERVFSKNTNRISATWPRMANEGMK